MSQRVKMGERRRRQRERRAAEGIAYVRASAWLREKGLAVRVDALAIRARQADCAHEGTFPGGMCLRCGAVVLPAFKPGLRDHGFDVADAPAASALPPRPAPRMVVGLDLAAGPDTVKTTVRIDGLWFVAEWFEQLGAAVGAVGEGLARHLDRLREQQDERIKAAFLEAKIPQADDGNRVVRETEKAGEK